MFILVKKYFKIWKCELVLFKMWKIKTDFFNVTGVRSRDIMVEIMGISHRIGNIVMTS